jgi:hypothetical protein
MGYPSWMCDMNEFLAEIDAIPVGGGDVTVTACVGSDCEE